MVEFIKTFLMSEFVFGALTGVVIWLVISLFERNSFLSKALPYIVEIFKFVEDKAKELEISGEHKWVLFLRLFIETYEAKHGTIGVNQLSFLKKTVNTIAAKQDTKLPALDNKYGDEEIRKDLASKTIVF